MVRTAERSYVPIFKGQSTIGTQQDLDTECLLRDMLAVIEAQMTLVAMVYRPKHVCFATTWLINHHKDKHNKKHTQGLLGCIGISILLPLCH